MKDGELAEKYFRVAVDNLNAARRLNPHPTLFAKFILDLIAVCNRYLEDPKKKRRFMATIYATLRDWLSRTKKEIKKLRK